MINWLPAVTCVMVASDLRCVHCYVAFSLHSNPNQPASFSPPTVFHNPVHLVAAMDLRNRSRDDGSRQVDLGADLETSDHLEILELDRSGNVQRRWLQSPTFELTQVRCILTPISIISIILTLTRL